MALSIHRLVNFPNIFVNAVRYKGFIKSDCLFSRRIIRTTSQASAANTTRDPANYFFENNVQELMDDICGDDFEKIFRVRKLGQNTGRPEYKFLTDEELKRELDALQEVRKELLQFPPVLLPRKEIHDVLSKDPKLQGLLSSKFLFTDITYGVDDSKRLIVARDPDGTLRHASWDERHRMNCIYFTQQGRDLEIPRMFLDENIQSVLDRRDYEFILDKACVQFEPDDPVYIEVTRRVYEEINKKKDFEIVYSTRHYGSLAFYLAFNANIDNILAHSIERRRISAAASLVKLLYIMHPAARAEPSDGKSPEQVIEAYIGSDPKAKMGLQLKWKRCVESETS